MCLFAYDSKKKSQWLNLWYTKLGQRQSQTPFSSASIVQKDLGFFDKNPGSKKNFGYKENFGSNVCLIHKNFGWRKISKSTWPVLNGLHQSWPDRLELIKLDLSRLNLSLIAALTGPVLTWPVLNWPVRTWLVLTWPVLDWPTWLDLSWLYQFCLDLSWLDLSYLDQSWIDPSWMSCLTYHTHQTTPR